MESVPEIVHRNGHKPSNISHMDSFILDQVIGKSRSESENEEFRHKKQKEHYLKLVKNFSKISDNQIVLKDYKATFTKFKICVRPNAGPYVKGKFVFNFHVPVKYPRVPPNIRCETKIYHPNIDDEGEICMSLLDDWCSEVHDLLDCVQGILFLFHNPNLDDPLSPYFSPDEINIDEFYKNVYNSLMGEEVEGIQFERNTGP